MKTLLILLIFLSVKGLAQNVPPTYTNRGTRESIIAFHVDSSIHIRGYNGVPTGRPIGSWPGDGMIGMDTTTGYLYVHQNNVWIKIAKFSDLAAVPINTLIAATGTNDINNGVHTQTWRWADANGLELFGTPTGLSTSLLTVVAGGSATSNRAIDVGVTGTGTTNYAIRSNATGAITNYSIYSQGGDVALNQVNGVTQIGAAGVHKGTLKISGNTSGTVTIEPVAAAGTYTLTLPTNDGDAGQFLQTDGSGALVWAAGGGSTSISDLTAATALNTIDNAALRQQWHWNTLAGTEALVLASTSTAAASNGQLILFVDLSGANANSTQKTTSAWFRNRHTGTSSTNVAADFEAHSGTINYAARFLRGKTSFGTAGTESGILEINGGTSGTVTLQPAAAAGTYTLTLPTDDGDASEVLTTNGSGVLTWETASGSGTVNTGAANKLAYYPGAGTTVDDVSQWEWDGSVILANPNNNTTSYQHRVGTFLSQSYALNNGFLSDNMYFNGSSWTRLATGYGYGFQFINGQVMLHGVNTGTGNFTQDVSAKFDYSGNFGVGAAIPAAAGDFTGSKFFVSSVGNVGIGSTTFGSTATNTLAIANGTAPTSSPANMVQIYSAAGEAVVRDAGGTTTTFSPHNFRGIPEGRSEPMAWSFYSEKDGKYVNVDMLKLARLVEQLTGEKLVYTGDVKQLPNPKNQ